MVVVVVVVVTGTAGAQDIARAISPAIASICGPKTFGAMRTFVAIFEMISPLAALSYPLAMVLPKQDSDATELAKISRWIALLTSLIAALVVTLFKTPLLDVFNLHTTEQYMLILPTTMLFSVLTTTPRPMKNKK